MAIPLIQSALSAGEISPELYGEIDLKKYAAAATTARNGIINYKGGFLSRGGLAFVGRCKQSTDDYPPRPIPFQFSITQGYILEFGTNYLRFVFQGGYVLESPIAITGATNANPAEIDVTGTPFANGDWVYIADVGGMTQLNGQTYIVAGATSGSFTLEDLDGNPVDSTAFGTYTSGGTASRLYTIATPYAAIDLPYLKFSQSADVMSLTCSNPETTTEYPPYDLTRLAADDWTLTLTDFDAVIQPPATVSSRANTIALDSTQGTNATFAYVVTAVDAKGNESVASLITSCLSADLEVQGATIMITWSLVSGAKYYNVYRSAASVSTTNVGPNPVPPGQIYGFVGSAYGTQFLDSASTRDLTQTPPTHLNPFAPGQILAVIITGGGSNLTAVSFTITTSTGSNFAGDPLVIGGSLGGFLIEDNGENYAPGDSIAFNGAGFASGAIEFGSTNPSPGDTITLNGVVWTFVTAITGPDQTIVQGTVGATVSLLASNLSSSTDPALTVASYAGDFINSNLDITYNTAGTGGNAYTLAASAATPSGSTLTGGAGTGSAGTHAAGSITFSVNLTNLQTIVLDGVTWTFVSSGATGNQTNIGMSLPATLTQLQLDLTASANADILLANYSVTATALDVAYKTVGTVGNAYTLGAGTSGGVISGASLTGGSNASSVPTGTLDIGPQSGTYPGVNVYFQQRHFFANSLNDPDTFWATQTGRYNNMDTAIPTVATDAITASPWTEQVNGIQWMIPMPGGLITFTGNRAWQILGEGSYNLNAQPITPTTTQAQPQAFNGSSATVPPIVVDYDVLYVEAVSNATVRDLSWTAWTNIYTGADLTILTSHLFLYRQIVQWTWARNPYKVLWACCNDGTLLSMTYLKEQEVYGWARSDTQGLVVGVASVTEPPVNAVYAIVQRFPIEGGPPPTTSVVTNFNQSGSGWSVAFGWFDFVVPAGYVTGDGVTANFNISAATPNAPNGALWAWGLQANGGSVTDAPQSGVLDFNGQKNMSPGVSMALFFAATENKTSVPGMPTILGMPINGSNRNSDGWYFDSAPVPATTSGGILFGDGSDVSWPAGSGYGQSTVGGLFSSNYQLYTYQTYGSDIAPTIGPADGTQQYAAGQTVSIFFMTLAPAGEVTITAIDVDCGGGGIVNIPLDSIKVVDGNADPELGPVPINGDLTNRTVFNAEGYGPWVLRTVGAPDTGPLLYMDSANNIFFADGSNVSEDIVVLPDGSSTTDYATGLVSSLTTTGDFQICLNYVPPVDFSEHILKIVTGGSLNFFVTDHGNGTGTVQYDDLTVNYTDVVVDGQVNLDVHYSETGGTPTISVTVAGTTTTTGSGGEPAFGTSTEVDVNLQTVMSPSSSTILIGFYSSTATVCSAPSGAAPSRYLMERMDNRIWQSVEDAYAVDSGISNPMASPNGSLFASALSGTGVAFTSPQALFSSANVGQIIRMGGGIATVTAYNSTKSLTGSWVLDPSPSATGLPFAPAGSWTIATPVSTLLAPHLAGQTIVGLADGVPISGLLVASDGTVTLPFEASDVKVGLSFTAQLQTPYLNGQQVIQGGRKVIPGATFRLASSGNGFQWGTNQPDGGAQNPQQIAPPWTDLTTANTLAPTGGQDPPPTYTSPSGETVTGLWTGDLYVLGGGGEWNSKGQVAIQQTLPVALEVTAVLPDVLPGDLPEETYERSQAQQQEPRPPGRWMLGRGPRL